MTKSMMMICSGFIRIAMRWMMAFWMVCILSQCSLDNQPPSNAGVVALDDRVKVQSTLYFPWSAIGKVEAVRDIGGQHFRSQCTGTMVSKNMVITAAHCIYAVGAMSADVVYFYPSSEDQTFSLSSKAKFIYVPPRFDPITYTRSFEQLRHDWAILILEDPLGYEVGFFDIMDVEMLKIEWPRHGLTMAGYSKNNPKTLVAHQNCNILQVNKENHLVYHDCDGLFGQSGAALWMDINHRPTIVAIASTHETIENPNASRGHPKEITSYGIAVSQDFSQKIFEFRRLYD